MKNIIFFFVFVATSAFAYEVVTDGEREYLLVPLDSSSSLDPEVAAPVRAKRQTSGMWDFGNKRGTISHTGTIYDNNNHNVMGTGYLAGGRKQPTGAGGSVDYTHKPSASTFSAGADHLKGYGTDVGVGGRYNFINKPNTQGYVEGNYNRHFGGPGGTGKPNYGAFVGLKHQF